MEKLNEHYVSGFVDGEGYFIARPLFRKSTKGLPRVSHTIRFGIQLRADDLEILERIKFTISEDSEIGNISVKKRKGDTSPQASLYYDGIKHNSFIIDFFERFPMEAKKAVDFLNWSKVYYELLEKYDPNFRTHGRVRAKNGHLNCITENYTFEEVEKLVRISSLCDLLRVGRIDRSMSDLGINELLRRFGGQRETYTFKTVDFLLSNNAISKEQSLILLNSYDYKI